MALTINPNIALIIPVSNFPRAAFPAFRGILCAVFSALLIIGVLAGCDSGAVTDQSGVAAPRLLFPADNATTADALALAWDSVADAISYEVEVASSPDFEQPAFSERGLRSRDYILEGLERGEACYWRVRAESADGTSEWSATRTFVPTVAAVRPEPPQLKTPAFGEKGLPIETSVDWEEAEGASRYHVQISIDSRFLFLLADLEQQVDSRLDVVGLVHTYPYWWRVRSWSPVGYGEWSGVWTFQIEDGN